MFNEAVRCGSQQVHNKGVPHSAQQRQKLSDSTKRYYKENGVSPERRKKLSENRKAYLAAHPEAHANVRIAGNRGKMTYPEKVAHDWFQQNGIEAPHNQRVGKYFPDFLVGNVIVEIDGERWHSSEDQMARDRKRDADLNEMGYTVKRIKATDRIEKALEELFLK